MNCPKCSACCLFEVHNVSIVLTNGYGVVLGKSDETRAVKCVECGFLGKIEDFFTEEDCKNKVEERLFKKD